MSDAKKQADRNVDAAMALAKSAGWPSHTFRGDLLVASFAFDNDFWSTDCRALGQIKESNGIKHAPRQTT